jgi:hypothetical protein
VPGDDERVYGLKGVTRLIRHFMTRVERGGTLSSLDFPVLVVEGFRGTGKSALLTRLAGLLGHVPYARLDLDKNRHASVPEILSAIAFDLSKKYPKYELQFPRFIVGQLVIGLDLNLTDHSAACEEVQNALRKHRDFEAVRNLLVDMAGSVLAGVSHSTGVPFKPSAGLLRSAVDWLAERAPGRAITLGPYHRWYGHRDLGLHQDAIDMLVDLNRWAADVEDEDNRQRMDELLLAAFLADLRAEFDHGKHADERSLNCVVLLDDADTELGRRFLAQLVTARRQRAVGEQDGADPLTVVATSRGGLLADVPDADQAMVEPEALRTGAYDVADLSRHWWLGVHLPDLTRDEVGRAAADMGLAWGNNQRITRVVHDLTGGHPAATSIVLDAIARGAPTRWVEPEVILARTDPGAESTVEDRILGRLLVGVSDGVRRDLVTCAAARRHAHALALAGVDGMLVNGRVGYDIVDRVLWPAGGAAGLTLLRRLLTRRLAARAEPDGPGWSAVHATLRRLRRDDDDEAGDLHYALADGELAFVSGRLRERLDELDSTAWFALATEVAAAPRRPRPSGAPIDEVRATVNAAGLDPSLTCVARLVVALQVAADPFADSRRRDVHLQIADDYGEVARLCPGGPHAVFLEASRRHRKEAEWWD